MRNGNVLRPQGFPGEGGMRAQGQGAGQGGGGRGSMLQSLMGGKQLRFNRLFNQFKGDGVLRIPDDMGADEYNVALGTGRTAVVSGATVNLTATAPRDLILRDLVISEQALAVGSAGQADATITSIQVEGNALVFSAGIPWLVFSQDNPKRPRFDLPVTGGTTVVITIVGGAALPAGAFFSACFSID